MFWIDVLPDHDDGIGGVLCRRHADTMVVPRGWTLDDLRDPELHLFRPPTATTPPLRASRPRASNRASDDATGEQLRLGDDLLASVDDDTEEDIEQDAETIVEHPAPWTATFDEGDDLDGLLSAQSPLLARAFRTAERPA